MKRRTAKMGRTPSSDERGGGATRLVGAEPMGAPRSSRPLIRSDDLAFFDRRNRRGVSKTLALERALPLGPLVPRAEAWSRDAPPMLNFLPASRPIAFCLALLSALSMPACKKSDSSASDSGTRDGGAPAASASGLPAPPDVAAPPADATKTASGLASKVLTPGTGTDHPGQNDAVKVNYTGWTTDGKMFDSSVAPLQPGAQGRSRSRCRSAA